MSSDSVRQRITVPEAVPHGQVPTRSQALIPTPSASRLSLSQRIWNTLYQRRTLLVLFIATGVAFGCSQLILPQSIPHNDYAARTDHLLRTTPLIDGHNDLPYLLRLELQNRIYDLNKFTFASEKGLASHTDLARLKSGRVGGQFWSVFVECPAIQHIDDPNHNVRDTLEQIDVTKRFVTENAANLAYCETSSCVKTAFKAGKIASMLGAEGLHQAGSAIGVIRQFWDLGVRYITLTHNCDNAFATAASTVTATGKDSGLTEFGIAGIHEMNRLGMMIDLSHVSHKTMRQVLDLTQSPVIFSHSGCYSLAQNYRNAPDDVLSRLKHNGGVIMIYFVAYFLDVDDPRRANVETAVDHIYHVVKMTGSWDHVGIGADFDGTVSVASGLNSVADYPSLIQAVLRRGATDEQVRKLVGENVLRVWKKNEVNARQRQRRGEKPWEDIWEGRRWFRYNGPMPVMIPGNPDRIRSKDYE